MALNQQDGNMLLWLMEKLKEAGANLKDGAVTGAKLAGKSVTLEKLGEDVLPAIWPVGAV